MARRAQAGARREAGGACEKCDERRYVPLIAQRAGTEPPSAAVALCPRCSARCERCDGERFVFVRDERGYRYAKPCPECHALRRRLELFNDARLPARHGQATFESFERSTPALARVHLNLFRLANGFLPGDQGFVLYGRPGAGKTHLMAAFLRRITLEKAIAARFIDFTHLLSALRSSFDAGRGDTDVIAPLIEVEVLAIDELGKGVNNEWQLSVLDELISKRYNLGRATLFTTNYSVEPAMPEYAEIARGGVGAVARESLPERVGERIFSRLFEMTEFIHVDAPDYRRRAGSTPIKPPSGGR